MKTKFAGVLHAFDNKTGAGNVEDESVVVDLTESNDGMIELSFTDRNEQVYIKFRHADLAFAMGAMSK